MYSKIQLALKYLNYYRTASNAKGHGIHSPFIFDLVKNVLKDKTTYPEFEKIERLRKKLLDDKNRVVVKDYGAGSSKISARSISSIARRSLKPPKFGQLFFRMVKKYKPQTIIELGTSLGITTSYLASANPFTRVISLEGSEQIANRALENFSGLGIDNIELVKGNFDDTLEKLLPALPHVDLAFIDGNHRREPTERYFSQLTGKTNNDSIIILDDIHWSGEMEEAWANIYQSNSVTCSVDLFFVGLVFFRKEFREKQHFVLRY